MKSGIRGTGIPGGLVTTILMAVLMILVSCSQSDGALSAQSETNEQDTIPLEPSVEEVASDVNETEFEEDDSVLSVNIGELIVENALTWLDVPRAWGGYERVTGVDCSGLIFGIITEIGGNPDYEEISQQTANAMSIQTGWWGRNTISVPVEEMQPGDLIFFEWGSEGYNPNGIDHAGIYLGGNEFLESVSGGTQKNNLANPIFGASRRAHISVVLRVVSLTVGESEEADTPAEAEISGDIGERIVANALTWLDVPRTWGGHERSTGVDCSGLVFAVITEIGGNPDYEEVSDFTANAMSLQTGWWGRNTIVVPVEEMLPGDLLFFESGPAGYNQNGIDHTGIYIGGNEIVESVTTGTQKYNLNDVIFGSPRREQIAVVLRVVSLTDEAPGESEVQENSSSD